VVSQGKRLGRPHGQWPLRVTAKGVDWAEKEEAAERLREDRLLPAVRDPDASR
jgi:hypothetical protein